MDDRQVMEEPKKIFNPSSLIIIIFKAIAGFLRTDHMQNIHRYDQDSTNYQYDGNSVRKKSKKETLIYTWIQYMSKVAKPYQKKIFLEQLLEKELQQCYQLQYSRHTIFYFINQWKEWHQPLFLIDKNFLAQLIFREINHYPSNYAIFFKKLETAIEKNVQSIIVSFKNQLSGGKYPDITLIEYEIKNIVAYIDFISQLGFYSFADNLIEFIIKFFNHPSYYTNDITDIESLFELLHCNETCKKFSPLLCEIRYNLLNIKFFQSNENCNHNIGLFDSLKLEMNFRIIKINELFASKSIEKLTESEQYRYKNILFFFKENAKYNFLLGKYDQAYKSIVVCNKLLEKILINYNKYIMTTLNNIKFPYFLYKLFIDCMLETANILMVKSNYKICDIIYKLCFSCARKYFENEQSIYAGIFMHYGKYMLHLKNYDTANQLYINAYILVHKMYSKHFCTRHGHVVIQNTYYLSNITFENQNSIFIQYQLCQIQLMRIRISQCKLRAQMNLTSVGVDYDYYNDEQIFDKISHILKILKIFDIYSIYNKLYIDYKTLRDYFYHMHMNRIAAKKGIVFDIKSPPASDNRWPYLHGNTQQKATTMSYVAICSSFPNTGINDCMQKQIEILHHIHASNGINNLDTALQYVNVGFLYILQIKTCCNDLHLRGREMYFTLETYTTEGHSTILYEHYLNLAKSYIQIADDIYSKLLGDQNHCTITTKILLSYLKLLKLILKPNENTVRKLDCVVTNLLNLKEFMDQYENTVHSYEQYEMKQIYHLLACSYNKLMEVTNDMSYENKLEQFYQEFENFFRPRFHVDMSGIVHPKPTHFDRNVCFFQDHTVNKKNYKDCDFYQYDKTQNFMDYVTKIKLFCDQ